MPLIHKPVLKISILVGALCWLVGAILVPLVVAGLAGILVLIMVLLSMGFDDTLIKIGG